MTKLCDCGCGVVIPFRDKKGRLRKYVFGHHRAASGRKLGPRRLKVSRLDDLYARIDAKTSPEPNTGCWFWTGSVNHSGYPMIRGSRKIEGDELLPHDGKELRVAHVNYERYRGKFEARLLRHTCDLPLCVSPYHLIPGTDRDNSHDCVKRGRSYEKLNDALLLEIVAAMEAGLSTWKAAARYGLCQSTTWKIKAGRMNKLRLDVLRRNDAR